jgi:Peptidase family M1 domain
MSRVYNRTEHGPAMKFRLLIILALTALASGPRVAGESTLAQAVQDADGVRTLLEHVERVLKSGDAQAYNELLSETADRRAVSTFVDTEILPGATRAVVRERDREPLTGTLPGNGYRLSIDTFTEFGTRGRSSTWRLDAKRVGGGSDQAWLIADQQRLSVVENLYRLSINTEKQFDARNLTITVEDFDLALTDGSAFVAEIDQGTTGLVLLGRGEVRFHPTPETEKGQLKIFSGAETLQTRFDTAYIRANPADLEKFMADGRLTPRNVDQRDVRRAEELFREDVVKSYSVDLSDLSREVWSLVPGIGDFIAEVHTQRFDTLTFTKSSTEAEDLSLFDRKRRKNISVYASRQVLERRGRSYNEDELVPYDILDHDIDLAVSPDRLWLEGRARLQLRVTAPALSSMSLRLAEPLVVQSIVSDRFGRLFGIRVRNQNTILINLPSVVLRDDDFAVTITYAGRLEPQREDIEGVGQRGQAPAGAPEEIPLLQPERSFLYSYRSYWYPQGTVTDYATVRLRLAVPVAYECVASGQLSEGFPTLLPAKESTPTRKLYEFTSSQPLRYLAFVVSRFMRSDVSTAGVKSSTTMNLSVQANPRQVRRGRELGDRAREIVQFYESILGDSPYPSFTLAVLESELPGGHSPGYFAALNQPLPTTPFVWRNDPASFDDYPEFFLAHELAHQWWGQAVGWQNYHEQWISEGFAQYFAALYAQRQRGEETFTNMLRQFRRWGMQQSDQGPIYLGYRLGHIRGDSRVFRAIVYNKSAAVLHMLRRLIGDDAFFRGVHRFYDSSRFRKVGTEDFRAVMESVTDRTLERFFERWIYGSTLPRLKFSYRVEPATEGQRVVLHVEQIGELFDVPLTVILQYADKREVQVTIPVTERVVDMPVLLTGTLRSVEISKDDGTLADIVKG